MDDLVLRGMAKWPNVPAVYGWLSLDRRGRWLIKGEAAGNPSVSAFIARNYERDGEGRWFFQNGPQRVFVNLDYTPYIYRAINGNNAALTIEAHTGVQPTRLSGAWIDEAGSLLLETELGIGVVHDQGLDLFVQAFVDAEGAAVSEDALDAALQRLQAGGESALWLALGPASVRIGSVHSTQVPRRFGFDPCPAAPDGTPECA